MYACIISNSDELAINENTSTSDKINSQYTV